MVSGEYPDDGEESSRHDGRRPKAYVRFEQTHHTQSGPMHGPFDGVDVRNDLLQGWRKIGPIKKIAERRCDSLWYLLDEKLEPGYIGFCIIFS